VWAVEQRNYPKTLPSMSYPTFSFVTTADEVAAAFAEEIKGKNGAHIPQTPPLRFLQLHQF
jgi:hypothetical protein